MNLKDKKLADFNKKQGTILFYCPSCGVWLKTQWGNNGMICHCYVCKAMIHVPSTLDIDRFHNRIRKLNPTETVTQTEPVTHTKGISWMKVGIAIFFASGLILCCSLVPVKPKLKGTLTNPYLPVVSQVCQSPTAKAMPVKAMPIVVRPTIDGQEQAEKWAEVKSAIMQIVTPMPKPIVEQPTRQVAVAVPSYETPPAPPVVSSESVKEKKPYPKFTQPTGVITRQVVAKENRQLQKSRSQPVHSHAVVIRGAIYWPPMPYIPRLTNRKG